MMTRRVIVASGGVIIAAVIYVAWICIPVSELAPETLTDVIKARLLCATSIEIGDCGPQMLVKTKTLNADSIERIVKTAVVVYVNDITDMRLSTNLYIEMRVRKESGIIDEWTFFFPRTLVVVRNGRTLELTMADAFADAMKDELLAM
jgi:hypothetical protein